MLLVDNAGWHVAKRLAVLANVRRHFLPPATPELQPTEPLWPLVREAVANRCIGRIDPQKLSLNKLTRVTATCTSHRFEMA